MTYKLKVSMWVGVQVLEGTEEARTRTSPELELGHPFYTIPCRQSSELIHLPTT